MNLKQCYRKDCAEPAVGAVPERFAPGGLVAYCAKHILWTPPDKAGWRCGACGHYVCAEEGHCCAAMRTADLYERAVLAFERIAVVLERDYLARRGPYDGEFRKVTAEEWEKLTHRERQWAFVP